MNHIETQVLINIYVTNSIDSLENKSVPEGVTEKVLLNESVESIYGLIRHNIDRLQPVDTKNIPQFSDINLIPRVVDIVNNSKEVNRFVDIGGFLTKPTAKYDAKRKFGENHYKLAVQLGLTRNVTSGFKLTALGEIYSLSSATNKELIMKKLILRIPIIQQLLLQAEEKTVDLTDYLAKYLSATTVVRRRSNTKVLLAKLSSISQNEIQHIINNINWD